MPKPRKRPAPVVVKAYKEKNAKPTAGNQQPKGFRKGKPQTHHTNEARSTDDRVNSGKGASTSSRQQGNFGKAPRHVAWDKQGKQGHAGKDAAAKQLQCTSAVDRQASSIVGRLLEADAARRHGATLKSLVFAPHIEAKKATYAVCCEVLKAYPVLEKLWQELTSSGLEIQKVRSLYCEGAYLRACTFRESPLHNCANVLPCSLGSGLQWCCCMSCSRER